jgi:hypothetical protein
MKTLEELAEEYTFQFSWNNPREEDVQEAYVAGYKAAQEQQEKEWGALVSKGRIAMQTLNDQFADADKVMFCVYCNDMHKGNCAVGKGKNHPALTQPQWISVKDRLPKEDGPILVWSGRLEDVPTCAAAGYELWNWSTEYSPHDYRLFELSHWMPLPKSPEE